MLWNLSNLEIDLSRSLKVKCDFAIELPIYGILLIPKRNTWHVTYGIHVSRLLLYEI